MAGAQHSHGPIEQGTPGAHTHGHTHAPRRNLADTLNWKIFLSSGSFAIILFLRLMVDHILGKVMLRNCTLSLFYPRKSNIILPNFRKELKEYDHFMVNSFVKFQGKEFGNHNMMTSYPNLCYTKFYYRAL